MTTISSKKWRHELQRLGDKARDRSDFMAAAEIYENVIRSGKADPGLFMAAGHMRKECKDFASAESHYLKVRSLTPDDPEIYMQLGHFYKTIGRYVEAKSNYALALEKKYPHPEEVLREFDAVCASDGLRHELERQLPADSRDLKGLISERLLPRRLDQIQRDYSENFIISRIGLQQKTKWGIGRTVRGIDSIRGHIISRVPIFNVEIFVADKLIHIEQVQNVPLRWEKHSSDLRKYVFNAWIDFSKVPFGQHDLVIRATTINGEVRKDIEWKRERIVVAEIIDEDYCAGSPASLPSLEASSPLSVVEYVNGLPSLVRKVTPGCFPGKIDTVAVMRLDQLGDMVVTVPAMRRLREILPKAKIVGLVSPANAGLAGTLGIFDDVITINFPDDKYQNKRAMEKKDQEAFEKICAPFNFDLAMDFLYSEHANKLLPLTGAPITMTVSRSDHVESLEVSFDSRSIAGGDCLSPMTHTAKARALTEALALWLNNNAVSLPRTLPCIEQLASYGLSPVDRYVVIHTGSSFAQFLRWPHYPELSRRLLNEGYKIFYMAGDSSHKKDLPADALEDGRIIYLEKKLNFDEFDALLSSASLMVGNDSGPKHWASLRGTKVVSIHPGRDDLREWGQVFGGVVLARRVPCAGCGIRYDDTECGKDFSCIKQITVDEVFRESMAALSQVDAMYS